MTKGRKILLIVGAVVLLAFIIGLIVLLAGKEISEDPTESVSAEKTEKIAYTVVVKNSDAVALPDVGVYVYTDSTKSELVWYDKTDAEGKMQFSDVASDKYVAVLDNVPAGYGVEEYYPLTGQATEIILSIGVLDEDIMSQVTYKLGDRIMDFSITDCEGNTYTLSQLLQEIQRILSLTVLLSFVLIISVLIAAMSL